MKKFLILMAVVALNAVTLISCNDDDDDTMVEVTTTQDIVGIAQANGFNKLAEALTRAGLVETLQGNGPFTVFAPTDQAFDDLLATIGQTSINDVPVSVLQNILTYHVVQGSVTSDMINAGDVTTVSGEDISITTSNGIQINGVNVMNPFDVQATNGVVHTINSVLVPPSIAPVVNSVIEPAYFNVNFSKLIEAAVKADLVPTLLNTPNLTIFAPNDDAFMASGIDPSQIDAETLAAVLTYHVIGSKVMSDAIPSEAATVNGAKMHFSLTGSGNFINGNTEITAVDIESGSGVVHVIDMVVMPPVGNTVETAIDLSSSGEFTSLIAALQRTADEGTSEQNLINVLSGDGPFTVFAPTNDAFQALLDSNMNWNSLADIPLETLIAVLTYHVVPAKAFDKDLAAALDANNELPTANGSNIAIDLTNLTINGDTEIVGVNTNTSNGVIHVINKVLVPAGAVETTQDIVQIAQANGFNSLAAALTRANLIETLQGDGPFTVFAPTDEAFASLLETIGQTSIDDVPVEVLQNILKYHVVEGKVASEMISAGNVTTVSGEEISISTMDGIKVNDASVINPYDVDATNGIVHTVNQVLVPPSIAPIVNSVIEPAYFNVNFSKLIEAAVKADVVSTLLDTPNLTIFAPNNDAFMASGIEPSEIDAETLAAVLTYHVIGAKVMSNAIPAEATTVNGAKINFSLTNSGNFINGNTEIIATDIESGSGVVHVIDMVVMPPSGNIVEKAIELSDSGEFTSLIAALQRTADEGTAEQNLITVLSGDGPFTVFAPTNAAFQALLDSNDDWSSLGDIPLETLIAVLTYHVVPAKAFDKDLAGAVDQNNQLPTANGSNITIDLNNLTINGDSEIVGVNSNATNGVIHVINKVLIP